MEHRKKAHRSPDPYYLYSKVLKISDMRSLALAAACGTLVDITNALPSPENQRIEWQPCPDELSRDLQCGYLDVPLDWDDPAAPAQVTLGIGRLAARKPEVCAGRCRPTS